MAKKNYRNPNVSHQDHALVKAFKIELMKLNLKSFQSEGFVPVWSREKAVKTPLEMELKQLECYAIPVAGPASLRPILKGVKRGCGLEKFSYMDKYGNEVSKPICELSERRMVDALKSLSQIVFEESFVKAIRFDENETRYLLLNAEQLKPEGRLDRIPFTKLINRFLIRIYNSGRIDADDKKQLIDEWHITHRDLNVFISEAIALNIMREAKEPVKTRRLELIKKIDTLIADVRAGGRRTEYKPVVLPIRVEAIVKPEKPYQRARDQVGQDIKRIVGVIARAYVAFDKSQPPISKQHGWMSLVTEGLYKHYEGTIRLMTDKYPAIDINDVHDMVSEHIQQESKPDDSRFDLDAMLEKIIDKYILKWVYIP